MPFSLKPVSGSDFVGREEIVASLVNRLKNRKDLNGFALYGNRRVGKTSILLEVKRKLEKEKDIVPIYFSIWDLVEYTSLEFCNNLKKETINAFKPKFGLDLKFEDLLAVNYSTLKSFLNKLEIKGEIADILTIAINSSKEQGKNTDELIEEAFKLCEQLALKTNCKAVLIIDEFPSITELKNGKTVGLPIVGKIRSIHENYKNTSICVSGSIIKTMQNTVFSKSSAFYGQLIPIKVMPLNETETRRLMNKNLKGKIDTAAIKKLLEITSGYPLYLNAIGMRLEKLSEISKREVENSFSTFIDQEGALLFRAEFEKYSSKEKSILIQLSKNAQTSTLIAKELSDAPSTIHRMLGYLEEKGAVEKNQTEYKINDPVFKHWISQTYVK